MTQNLNSTKKLTLDLNLSNSSNNKPIVNLPMLNAHLKS